MVRLVVEIGGKGDRGIFREKGTDGQTHFPGRKGDKTAFFPEHFPKCVCPVSCPFLVRFLSFLSTFFYAGSRSPWRLSRPSCCRTPDRTWCRLPRGCRISGIRFSLAAACRATVPPMKPATAAAMTLNRLAFLIDSSRSGSYVARAAGSCPCANNNGNRGQHQITPLPTELCNWLLSPSGPAGRGPGPLTYAFAQRTRPGRNCCGSSTW